VSFGYDVIEHRCVLQLLFAEESEKRVHLEESNRVNLVSYEWADPDDWRSVVLDGKLHPIEDEPETLEAAEVFAEYASVAGLTVFNEPVTELDPEWFELRVDAWSGYRSPLVADDSLD
jgi:nitroimidazol reductase NimA-like FMN-containing flavoprotein (pyridoxamine 5'-phosphate oxidase superfamily)